MKRWPLQEAYFWEKAPFFRLLLPLAIGISSYTYLALQEYVIALSVFFVLVIASYAGSLSFKASNSIRYIQFTLIHIAFILAGWLSFYQFDINNKAEWFGHYLDKNNKYEVRITSPAEEKDKTWKYNVTVTNIINDNDKKATVGEAFLYVYKYSAPAYQEGDLLLLPNDWQPIKNAGNPYEFDYARFCADKNIYFQQFLSGKEIEILAFANEKSLNWIRRIHNWSLTQLETYISDRNALGVLGAILAGERSTLDKSTIQNYANTGIVHVIAISGAHISIFFFIVLFLLSSIRHRKYRWIKYLAALPLIWLYVLVAGAPASAVRAALMFSILGVGFAFQKQQNGINQLLVTAFFLLLIQPTWLFAVGFQLSFLAVLSLFLFYKPIFKLLSIPYKPLRILWGVIAASIAAEILIAPLVIYYFHLFPIQFIVANIIAYFFMSTILIVGMAIVAFSSVPAIASILSKLAVALVTYFNSSIAWLAPLNPKSFQYLQIDKLELLLIYLAIISISIFVFRKKKEALFVGVLTTVSLIVTLSYQHIEAEQQERLIVYNINRIGYIERISGKKHHMLNSSKELSEQTSYYTLRPAHTQWHAWQETVIEQNTQVSTVNNQNILIVSSKKEVLPDTSIDILIVNYNIKEPDFQHLIKTYQPNQVVFSSILSRKKTANWSDKRKEIPIPIHITGIDGAFIFSNK